MLVKEMHVELDGFIQEVDSNRYDALLPEEKDMFLTNSMMQFIENRINPQSNIRGKGLQEDVKRYEDLQAIINKPITLPVYIDNSDVNKVYTILPANHHHLLADVSVLSRKCLGYSYTTQQVVEDWIAVVPFNYTTSDITTNFKVLIDAVEYFDITDFPNLTEKLEGYDAKHYFVHAVIAELALKGIEVRWEYYGEDFYKDSFIFVSTDATVDGLTVSITIAGSTLSTADYTGVTRTKIVVDNTLTTQERPNRLTKTEYVDNLRVDPISKTNYASPLSVMEGNSLKVFFDDTFVVHAVKVRYIRKPRIISSIFNYNCELASRFHREIVLLAAQQIKAYLNSPDYKLMLNENAKME